MLLVISLSMTAACGTRVTEQYHGIETSFGEITSEKLPQGYNWEGYGTDTHLIPLVQQNYPARAGDDRASAEVIDNAVTRDSLVVAGDVALTWRHNPAVIVKTFREKGGANIDLNDAVLFEVQNALRDGFRSAAATQSIEDLIGPNRANFSTVVKQHVQAKLGERALIDNVYIRGIRLPQAITQARENIIKQAADLKAAQNQLAIAEANSRRQIAEAQGAAEANRLRAQSYAVNPRAIDLEIADRLSKLCQGVTTCIVGQGPQALFGLK